MFLTIILSGCFKCPEDKRYYPEPISDVFIQYFASYKDGSYWVYEDSISGRVDTFLLTDYGRSTGPSAPYGCDYQEAIGYKMINGDGIELRARLIKKDTAIRGSIYVKYSEDLIDVLRFIFANNNFYERYNRHNLIPKRNHLLNDSIYSEVIEVRSNHDDIILYFKPNVGLIQYKQIGPYHKSLNYKLLDYQIKN